MRFLPKKIALASFKPVKLQNTLHLAKNARIEGLADIIHIHLRIKNHGISQTKKEKPSSSLWP
jgi:hypothetical protein